MRRGARTPEELETLLEDAFVVRDRDGLGRLFESGGVLLTGRAALPARGIAEITRAASALWERERRYLAGPQRVVQARDTALMVAAGGIHVARRDTDRVWRYAISLLEEPTIERTGK